MIQRVDPLVAAGLGLLLGLAVGFVLFRRRRQGLGPGRDDQSIQHTPLLGSERAIVEHLRGPAAIIGPHDEVLVQSPSAASSGLIRGSRLTHTEVLELVREARHEVEPGVLNIEVPTGLGMPPRPLAVRVTPLDGERLFLVADDRSEALRVDSTRRDFVANVTHELKTPIGAISLLAEAINDAADEPEAVRRFSARMTTESHRLNELISQIIALSRLQSSDPLLAAVDLDLDEVVDVVFDQASAQADNRGILLAHQRSSGAFIRGDRQQIEAALRNLVQNAIAYSDPGARVVATTRRVTDSTGEWIEVGVSDNGIGIAEADQPRVFERFFRVDYGRSRAHGGTGLGLSIVKHIAAAHGGSVTLWSRLGQGSTFTLRLPARAPHDAEGTAA